MTGLGATKYLGPKKKMYYFSVFIISVPFVFISLYRWKGSHVFVRVHFKFSIKKIRKFINSKKEHLLIFWKQINLRNLEASFSCDNSSLHINCDNSSLHTCAFKGKII